MAKRITFQFEDDLDYQMQAILHLHLILKQGLRCFHKIKVEQSDLKLLM